MKDFSTNVKKYGPIAVPIPAMMQNVPLGFSANALWMCVIRKLG